MNKRNLVITLSILVILTGVALFSLRQSYAAIALVVAGFIALFFVPREKRK